MEVEIKARANESALKYVAENMGRPEILHQRDVYYDHPCKSYAESDESVRVRHENGKILMTYKGPKIDRETKTRKEIEFRAEESAEEFLEALGFVKKLEIIKERRVYHHKGIEVCVDHVRGLGTFIELEIQGNPDEKERLFSLAEEMGLKDFITESYLELMLKKM